MNTKKFILMSLVAIIFYSCATITQIGDLNMISKRNIDSDFNYELISTYAGGSKKELKKSKATNIEEAVDQTVRKVAGGEFVMNAKIYKIEKRFNTYFAVEGDIWGKKEKMFREFKINDIVIWKTINGFSKGKIISFKDDTSCLIETEKGDIIEKKFSQISKLEQ